MNFRDEFDTMLDATKGVNCFRDLRGLHPGKPSCYRGRKNVFQIVRARERNFVAIENFFFFIASAKNEFSMRYKSALLNIGLPAEPKNLRARRNDFAACRVIQIEDRRVLLDLVLENPSFGSSVSTKGLVAVQMVRRKVQQNSDARTKCFDHFELKAAELRNGNRAFRRLVGLRDQRRANVSRKYRRETRVTQNVIDERSSRGLTVRTGNANQATPHEPRRQFNFAPDRDFQFTRFDQERRVGRNAGARHHQFLPVQNRVGVSAQLQLNACIAQFRYAFAQFVCGSRVGGSYNSSAFRAKERGGDAGTRQSDDQHAFFFQLQLSRPSCTIHSASLTQLQSSERKQRKYQRQNPESHDYFRFAPSQ